MTSSSSLQIVSIVREKQQANGIAYGDYERYSQYCSRKIRRLKQKLGLTQGKGGYRLKKKPTSKSTGKASAATATKPVDPEKLKQLQEEYKFKKIQITTVKEMLEAHPAANVQEWKQRLLQLVLFQSERNWAYAIHLKQLDIDQNKESRKQFHSDKRLKKSLKWADKMSSLISEVGDEQSHIESDAYQKWMQGNLFLHRKQYQEAMNVLLQSRMIYSQLQNSIPHMVEQYRLRMEEFLDPNIRLCYYHLYRDSSVDLEKLMQDHHASLGNNNQIQSKLDTIREESQKTQIQSMNQIQWNQELISVENEKIKANLIQLQNYYEKNLSNSNITLDAKLKIYDKEVVLLSDCLDLLKEDMKQSGSRTEVQVQHLRRLFAYLTFLHIEKNIAKYQTMIDQYVQNLWNFNATQTNTTGGAEEKSKKKKKSYLKKQSASSASGSALDIVRFYDLIVQQINELETSVPGLSSTILSQYQNKILFFRSNRCYFLGQGHLENREWREAFALFVKSQELLEQYSGKNQQDKANQEWLNKIKTAQGTAKAHYTKSLQFSKQIKPQEDAEQEITTSVPLDLDQFKLNTKGKPNLITIPPPYESIPTKPIFFDIAGNYVVDFPDDETLKSKYKELSEQQNKRKKWFGIF